MALHWNDAARVLTLDKAQGRYPGMPERVHIRLVVVGEDNGAGAEIMAKGDGEAVYEGSALHISCRP